MMPRLDGFGVIEQLRANPVTQDLPIIVISAKELTDEESARLKESVTFVMRKQGFDGEKLVQEIKMRSERSKVDQTFAPSKEQRIYENHSCRGRYRTEH